VAYFLESLTTACSRIAFTENCSDFQGRFFRIVFNESPKKAALIRHQLQSSEFRSRFRIIITVMASVMIVEVRSTVLRL
jgi:hypothetical protein